MNATLSQRLRVKFRTELRLLAWPALAMPALLLLRLWYRLPASAEDLHVPAIQGIASTPVRALAQLLPVWMVFVSVRADAPSNSNTASLTRPVGGAVLWVAKLVTLMLTIAVPWLLADLYIASAVPQSAMSWLAIAISSGVNTLSLIALAAAVGCLANSQRQLIVIALAGVAVWGLWEEWLHGALHSTLINHQASPTLLICAANVAQLATLITAMVAWWFAMAQRHARAAIVTLVAGVVLVPLIQRAWPFDWIARPALRLESPLKLQLGKHDPSKDITPGQALWPTLRITGLGPDEVATVLAFAPITSGKPWPAGSFTTDFDINPTNSVVQWMNNDHVRRVMDHYAADDLWPNSETRENPHRPALAKLIKNTSQPWRLRLAVHRMKQLGERHLSDIINNAVIFPVREGASLRLGPERSTLNFYCGLQEVRSNLLPERAFAPITSASSKPFGTQAIPFNFLLVSHDPEAREDRFNFASLASYWGGQDSSRGLLTENTNHRGIVFAWLPAARISLGFTNEENYKRTTTVQVWTTEDAGTIDFDLTPQQLRQALYAD